MVAGIFENSAGASQDIPLSQHIAEPNTFATMCIQGPSENQNK